MIITYYPELSQEIPNLGFCNGEDLKKYFRRIKFEFLLFEHDLYFDELSIIECGKRNINENFNTHLMSASITVFNLYSKFYYNMYFYVPKTKEELMKILKLKVFA